MDEIQRLIQAKEVKTDIKSELTNLFKQFLDVVRTEGLTGDKALRNITYLLTLKLIEPQINDKRINLDDYDYDLSHIEDHIVDAHKQKLLRVSRFSHLSDEKEENIPSLMKKLWDDILSQHPTTKKIFLKDKGFDIKYASTYKKIVDKLKSFDFTTDLDILGESYENLIQDIMRGKILGQFFTNPLIKKMMVELVKPRLYPDGKIDTCCDPTMGTGGFLISYLKEILDQSKTKGIDPDWNFIKTEGLYGKELEPDTYQLAVSNMLISSGRMFDMMDMGDSIRDPIIRKFDIVLANPPFGIKGLKYDEFQSSFKNEYVPIKSDNAVSLFIQAIIYMLNIGGKCAVVLPFGQDLCSKTNNTLISVREYLMKTCDLKEIHYLPSGIFEYTPIKTCVFYFVKKKEGTDVLKSNIKLSKTQKETGRDYVFTKTHQTSSVKFYDYNPYKDFKHLLVEVQIEKIAEKSYSLNYADYMKDDTEEYEEGVVKTIGEVCSIDYGTRIVRKDNVEGEYSVYGSGRAMFSTKTFNRDGFNILIGRFALSLQCVRFVNEKIFLNDSGLSVIPKIDGLLHKYIGYYLMFNQSIIYNCSRGTAQQNLDIDEFKSIKIQIPSLERQKEIVEYLDFMEKATKTSIEKIAELKRKNDSCLKHQKIFGENEVKTLGEVFHIEKGTLQSSKNIDGEYTFITASDSHKTHENFTHDCECVMLVGGAEGSLAKAHYFNGKFIASDLLYILISKKNINYRYVWYYLNLNREIHLLDDAICCGTPKRMISKDRCSNIKIQIPSLERQKEIVEYCEYNDALIKQLETEIEMNKRESSQFLRTAISQIQDTES
jgi:type I restriction-modification system DNA methylase subunit